MSKTPSRAEARAESRIERRQHWIAVLASALLHVLFVLLGMWSAQVKVSTPQGSAAGSRVAVDFIGEAPPPPSKAPAKQPARPAAARPAVSRVQTTQVTQAEDPVPPDVPDPATESPVEAPATREATASPPPTPARRRSPVWGQPPGMLQEDLAPQNAGLARSASTVRGRRNDAADAGPSMEVGGYQVYYDLLSETRLRAWRDQGITEIFLPLPGTRRYMVCPLETALKRESGPCRLLEPDSPELARIGDARQAINMQKVYKQGEVVWSGPGPYK